MTSAMHTLKVKSENEFSRCIGIRSVRMGYTRAGSSGRVYTFTLAAAPGCGAQGVGKRVNYHLRRVTDIIGNKARARIHDFLIALVIYPREGIDSSFFFCRTER